MHRARRTSTAVLALAAAITLGACGSSAPRSEVGPGRELAPSMVPLQSPVLVPQGSSLTLVTGGLEWPGQTQPNRVMRYDSKVDRWTDLGSPFEPPVLQPAVVWTGDTLVIVGAPCARRHGGAHVDPLDECDPSGVVAAAYSHARGWRLLPAPPQPAREQRFGYYHDAIGWDGTDALFIVDTRIVGYNPARDAWTVRSTDPRVPRGDSCVEEGRVVVLTTQILADGGPSTTDIDTSTSDTFADPRAYSIVHGRFVPLAAPPVPASSEFPYRLACTGSGLTLWSRLETMYTYSFATGRWQTHKGVMTGPAPWSNSVVTDHGVVFWDGISGQGWRFDGERFTRLDPPPPEAQLTSVVPLGTRFAGLTNDRFVIFAMNPAVRGKA